MPESKSSSSGVLDRLDEESSRWDLPYAIRNTMIDAAAEIRRLQAVEAAHANLRQVHDDLSRRESGLYNEIIAIATEVALTKPQKSALRAIAARGGRSAYCTNKHWCNEGLPRIADQTVAVLLRERLLEASDGLLTLTAAGAEAARRPD